MACRNNRMPPEAMELRSRFTTTTVENEEARACDYSCDSDDSVYQSSSSYALAASSSSRDVSYSNELNNSSAKSTRGKDHQQRITSQGRSRNNIVGKLFPMANVMTTTFNFPSMNFGVFRKRRDCREKNEQADSDSDDRLSSERSSRMMPDVSCKNDNCEGTQASEHQAVLRTTADHQRTVSLFDRLNNRLRGGKSCCSIVHNVEADCPHYSGDYAGRTECSSSPGGVDGSLSNVSPPSTSETGNCTEENMDRNRVSNNEGFNCPVTLVDPSGIQPSTSMNKSGGKYRLVVQGQVQACRVKHPRNFLGKLTSSKLLRRWEVHTIVLGSSEIYSKTPGGCFARPLNYADVEDIQPLPQWDSSGGKYCLRIIVPDGSVLLQTNRVYALNQWFYSIQWKRSVFRCRRLVESNCDRTEVLVKEIKSLIEQAGNSPLQADNLISVPVQLVCTVLRQTDDVKLLNAMMESLLPCIAPVLDRITVIADISYWLSKHCRQSPRSPIIEEVLGDVAVLTLKKNMDFGKYESIQAFLQDFLFALSSQNDGYERVKTFVRNAHGLASSCPHPRVLPNLVSVCLAAMQGLVGSGTGGSNSDPGNNSDPEARNTAAPIACTTPLSSRSTPDHCISGNSTTSSSPSSFTRPRNRAVCNTGSSLVYLGAASYEDISQRLSCIATVFDSISGFEDWRPSLASLLQSVPFPEEVLLNVSFMVPFSRVLGRIGLDTRCEVHLAVLSIREGKEGWLHLTCPGGPACIDDGQLFTSILDTLLRCCCRRKKFLQSLNVMLGPLQLLALRECGPAVEALSSMLESDAIEGRQMKVQIIETLLSTPTGKRNYHSLRDRQSALRELQQKGGPRKLTLPSKSTDADLAVLFASGSFGNLEWLSLAFTNVTSACAEYLIKLPSLRYLNLWSTQFGDVGVQLISEHLHKLQVLNLCETPVTDNGLRALSALTNLRKLNLNSTQLSANTFQTLRAKLPALQEIDVRYTDAWCVEDFLTWP